MMKNGGIGRRLADAWGQLAGDWKPLVEKPMPAADVDLLLRSAAIPSWGFFFMLIIASAIATFGLLQNSAPAIIGAMIIAPLMAPIIGLAYGIVIVEPKQVANALFTVVTGALAVVVFAYLSTSLIGLRVAGSEILSRTTPTLLDLGVAMAAGAAGAFAYTRKSIMNSIAGVAIAVALVPPLAVTGVGIALGSRASADVGLSLTEVGLYSGGSDIATGAFVLFLTNLSGIVVVAGIVLVSQRYGRFRTAILGLGCVTALSVSLAEPLGTSLHRLRVKSRTMRLMATLPALRPDLFDTNGRMDGLHVNYVDGLLHVKVDGVAARERVPDMQERIDSFRDYLAESLGEPVVLELEIIPVDTIYLRSTPTGAPQSERE